MHKRSLAYLFWERYFPINEFINAISVDHMFETIEVLRAIHTVKVLHRSQTFCSSKRDNIQVSLLQEYDRTTFKSTIQ